MTYAGKYQCKSHKHGYDLIKSVYRLLKMYVGPNSNASILYNNLYIHIN